MSAEPPSRAHVRIVGRVQGVGFRYATLCQARRQHLTGWVRNLDSGAVEAVFEGSEDALEAIVRWCADGPPGAYVRDCQVAWDEPPEDLADFSIR
ncbi:MAG: acylphosphatase [Chloroflexota bacterium]